MSDRSNLGNYSTSARRRIIVCPRGIKGTKSAPEILFLLFMLKQLMNYHIFVPFSFYLRYRLQ